MNNKLHGDTKRNIEQKRNTENGKENGFDNKRTKFRNLVNVFFYGWMCE